MHLQSALESLHRQTARRKKGAAPGAQADKLVMLAVGMKAMCCQRIWRCWHFHFHASVVSRSCGCNWRPCHWTLCPGLSVHTTPATLDYLLFDGIQRAAKDKCHCLCCQGLFYTHRVCVCLCDSILRQSSTRLAKSKGFLAWVVPVGDFDNSPYHSIGGVCSLCFPRGHAQSTASVVHKLWDAVVKSLFSGVRLFGFKSSFYH